MHVICIVEQAGAHVYVDSSAYGSMLSMLVNMDEDIAQTCVYHMQACM